MSQVHENPERSTPFGPRAADSSPAAPASTRGVILLAEDRDLVRKLYRAILTRAGWAVLEAADGEQARILAHTTHLPIDLLVTDVDMPGVDGLSLARGLVDDGRVRRIIVSSGRITAPDTLRCGQGARWVFLPKPFRATDLLSAVEEVMADEGWSAAAASGPRAFAPGTPAPRARS